MINLRPQNLVGVMKRGWPYFQFMVIITCFLYMLIAGFFGSTIGRADQGDWERCFEPYVSKPLELSSNWPDVSSPEYYDRFFKHWIPFWTINTGKPAHYRKSSAHLLWIPGFELNKLFFSNSILDIRFISIVPRIVTFLIFVFFIWLFARYNKPNAILFLIVGITLILTDLYYTSYFNTFYQETGSFIYASIAVTSLFLVMTGLTGLTLFIFLIANVLLILSKTQDISISVSCFITLVTFLILFKKHRLRTKFALIFVFFVVLAGSSYFSYTSSSDSFIKKCNAYHRLFRGALKASDKRAQLLESIGLKPEDEKYIGTSPWSQNAIDFFNKSDFTLSDFLIVVYKDPIVIPRLLYFAFKKMNLVDSMSEFGVREKTFQSIGPPIGFSLLSLVKQGYGPRGWALIAVDAAFFIIASLLLFNAKLRLFALLIYYSLFSHLMELMVVVFGDGEAAITKHLYLANVMFDYSALFVLSALIAYFEYRKRNEADSPFTIGG
jgi:hypothetical protein